MSSHSVNQTIDRQPADADEAAAAKQNEIRGEESRNLILLAFHHVWLRIGWIFKTETVIMPAFLDMIHGAGWVRGCLPMLNRIGQSVPPMYFADRLRNASHKKWALAITTLCMAIPFLALSLVWALVSTNSPSWMPLCFLGCYGLFFATTGLNQVAFGTVQGKLIRAHRRGRLMIISSTVGSVASIGCAYFFLSEWLLLPDHGFSRMFLITGCGFLVSGCIVMFVREPRDHTQQPLAPFLKSFGESWNCVREDRDLRRLVIVAMLFITAQLAFPHYVPLGTRVQTSEHRLMYWLVAQNAGAGFFGMVAGIVADRWGNRLVLRVLIFGASLTPLMAVGLASWFPGSPIPFWVTFFVLGTVPTTFKSLTNYALEITTPTNHPRYISTLRLAMMLPFVLSPLFGWMIDAAGFEPVFVATSGVIATGGVMTFWLAEPRLDAKLVAESAPLFPSQAP